MAPPGASPCGRSPKPPRAPWPPPCPPRIPAPIPSWPPRGPRVAPGSPAAPGSSLWLRSSRHIPPKLTGCAAAGAPGAECATAASAVGVCAAGGCAPEDCGGGVCAGGVCAGDVCAAGGGVAGASAGSLARAGRPAAGPSDPAATARPMRTGRIARIIVNLPFAANRRGPGGCLSRPGSRRTAWDRRPAARSCPRTFPNLRSRCGRNVATLWQIEAKVPRPPRVIAPVLWGYAPRLPWERCASGTGGRCRRRRRRRNHLQAMHAPYLCHTPRLYWDRCPGRRVATGQSTTDRRVWSRR